MVFTYILKMKVRLKTGVHKNCGIGLPMDFGVATTNKIRTVPLRTTKIVDGITTTHLREWLYAPDEIEVIPSYFIPIYREFDQSLRVAEGSRNDLLWNHNFFLQTSLMFTYDEITKISRMVNKYMFETPLPDDEVRSITRKDAFSEELFFGKKGNFLHNKFADWMLLNCNIVKIENIPHIYSRKGLYTAEDDEFKWVMTNKIPTLKDAQKEETLKFVHLMCSKEQSFAKARYIGLKDSILDINTMEEFPYSPNWIITNKIEHEYIPSAYSKVMDITLNKVSCNDKQIRLILEEMIGYSLYRKNIMQKCFILTGGGNNGKSAVLDAIKLLLGNSNITALSLQDLETRFKPAEMHNKLANIGDDISAKSMETASVFKKVVTGESFSVEKKYGQPFDLSSYATQIFCANKLPKIKDKTDGFNRRIVLLPFKAKFSENDADYDINIGEKLASEESMQYLLKLGVEGLKRIINTKKFTTSDKGMEEQEEYKIANNSVLAWIDETEYKIHNEAMTDVLLVYKVWCVEGGYVPMDRASFKTEILKLGYKDTRKNINGKTTRIYIKEEI